MKYKLALVILWMLFSRQVYGQSLDTVIAENIKQVESLYLLDKESLPSQKVALLASDIIKQRKFYSADTIAKVFILLSDTADNRGDITKAMQFANDGVSLLGITDELKLNLLLKLLAGNYINGKINQVVVLANEAEKLARKINKPKYLLIALSYSAMSNALNGQHQVAYQLLQQVEQYLSTHERYSEHIDFVEILALAYLYQQDFLTSKSLYNKAIKLRFATDKIHNIDRSYYYLAQVEYGLGRFDDAFHAYFAAKEHAELNNMPIRIAFALLGLGRVSYMQQEYQQSLAFLTQAKTLFEGQNLSSSYLSTLIALAKTYQALADTSKANQYIMQAEQLAQNVDVTVSQIELYQLLTEMYQQQELFEKAFYAQATYHYYSQRFESLFKKNVIDDLNEQTQQLALNMAEDTGLRQSYEVKYYKQERLIAFLIGLLIIVFIGLCYFFINYRSKKLNQAYDEIEKPADYIASPSQTKKVYQHHYKMARKYEYPLAVGYLSVDNWKELSFRFNKKVVDEVARTIATLINEHAEEFDQVGLINHGEYIFLSPHQNVQSLHAKLNRLTNGLKTRFFANLGDFSVKISYAFESPSAQDIDPYIFLSRLSESTRSEYTNFKK